MIMACPSLSGQQSQLFYSMHTAIQTHLYRCCAHLSTVGHTSRNCLLKDGWKQGMFPGSPNGLGAPEAHKKRTCAKGTLVLELLTEQRGARWPAAMAATLLRPKKVHSLCNPLRYACTGLLYLQISRR